MKAITGRDSKTSEIKIEIILEGSIDSVNENFQITLNAILKNLGGETINIKDIKPGSIKITFQGSQEDVSKLIDCINSREITELNGFPIKDVRIIAQNFLANVDQQASANKWELAQEISNQTKPFLQLSNQDLSDVDLGSADLSGADLSSANLKGANFSNANLSEVDLSSVNLKGANFSNANLSEVDLSSANLKGANLERVNLERVVISAVSLEELDFSSSILLSKDSLSYTFPSSTIQNMRAMVLGDTILSGKVVSGQEIISEGFNNENLSNTSITNLNLNLSNYNYKQDEIAIIDFTRVGRGQNVLVGNGGQDTFFGDVYYDALIVRPTQRFTSDIPKASDNPQPKRPFS